MMPRLSCMHVCLEIMQACEHHPAPQETSRSLADIDGNADVECKVAKTLESMREDMNRPFE